MPRPEKIAEVEGLQDKLSRARGVVLVDFLGLSAPEMVELRRIMRGAGVEFRVVKNTLTQLAARNAGADYLAEHLRGPNAVVVGYDDPTVPFRVSRECAKRFKKLQVKAGLFVGEPVAPDEVDWYANLPSREELLGRLAGGLAAPIRGLAVALAGVVRGLAVAVAEVRRQKEAKG
ncbi:MAG: 50S ribosomal protein L10 [Candidatus Bipolaricaulaceae bacterium]